MDLRDEHMTFMFINIKLFVMLAHYYAGTLYQVRFKKKKKKKRRNNQKHWMPSHQCSSQYVERHNNPVIKQSLRLAHKIMHRFIMSTLREVPSRRNSNDI